jgi:hypothetical protein
VPSIRGFAGASALLLVAILVAACSGAGGPSPTAVPATPRPTPTDVPGAGGSGGSGGGSGSGGNTGGGIVVPGGGGVGPGVPVPDPFLGDAQAVNPQPGQLNPQAVNVGLIRAAAGDDGKVSVELRWYSGVAPCNNLDSVRVTRDDDARTIQLTVIEGNGPGDVACIDIAQLKSTVVDLGVLAAGTWTISAQGDASAIEVTIE